MGIDAVNGTVDVSCDNCGKFATLDIYHDGGIDNLNQMISGVDQWKVKGGEAFCPNCQK